MKTKLLFLSLFISIKTFAQIPGDAVARLNNVFDSVCTKYKIKGASAAIIVPGIGTWKGVHGFSHGSVPISEDMRFGIGSNTKTFISVLMLKAQEEGLLDLDDSIGEWIKNVPNVNGKITIRQMLNHTSGIYSFTNNADWVNEIFADQKRIWKPEELLEYIKAPLSNPGKSWSYSNTNYLLAGIILEKINQKPLHILLREKILSPQALKNTFLFPDETVSAPFAHPWTYVYDYNAPTVDITKESVDDLNAFYSCAWAAGSIMSTAEDNALFWHRLMSGLIINQQSLAELKQYKKISAIMGYGLGIFREKNFNGRTVYTHGGTGFGFVNENITDSINGNVFSVLTNQDSVGNGIVLNQLIKALHKVTIQNQTLSINQEINQPEILVYPNPSNGKIYLKMPAGFAKDVSVINVLGQEVFSVENLEIGAELQTINLSNEKSGIYFVIIKNHDKIYTRKVSIVTSN